MMYSDQFKLDNMPEYQQQFCMGSNYNDGYNNKRRHSSGTSHNHNEYDNIRKNSNEELQRQKEQIQEVMLTLVRRSGVLMNKDAEIKNELGENSPNSTRHMLMTTSSSILPKDQTHPSSSTSITIIESAKSPHEKRLLELDSANSLLPSFDQISRITPALQCRKFFDDLQPLDRILVRVVRTGIAVLQVELVCMLTRFRRNLISFMKGRLIPVAFDRTKRFYQVNDYVSTTVMSISPNSMELELQLDEEEAIYTHQGVPAYSRDYDDTTFDNDPQISRLRDNPNLAMQLGVQINTVHSALPSLWNKHLDLAHGAEQLRKEQTHKLAMTHVVRGAELTRENKCFEAIQCFNKALAIDDKCADAYVGRGAACAGNRNFSAALQDLEKAVELQPYHRNANKYRMEVLMAYGRDLERSRNLADAREKYDRVLELHAGHSEASEALQRINDHIAVEKPELIELSPDREDGNTDEATSNDASHNKHRSRKPDAFKSEEEIRKNREKLREMEEFIRKLKSGK